MNIRKLFDGLYGEDKNKGAYGRFSGTIVFEESSIFFSKKFLLEQEWSHGNGYTMRLREGKIKTIADDEVNFYPSEGGLELEFHDYETFKEAVDYFELKHEIINYYYPTFMNDTGREVKNSRLRVIK